MQISETILAKKPISYHVIFWCDWHDMSHEIIEVKLEKWKLKKKFENISSNMISSYLFVNEGKHNIHSNQKLQLQAKTLFQNLKKKGMKTTPMHCMMPKDHTTTY